MTPEAGRMPIAFKTCILLEAETPHPTKKKKKNEEVKEQFLYPPLTIDHCHE
jgi:hypothetical protein